MRRGIQVFCLFSLVGFGALPALSQDFEPKAGTLHEANAAFHGDYEGLLKQTLDNFGKKGHPVLIFPNDNMVVMHDGSRTATRVISPLYHNLKAVAHVPFGLYLALTAYGIGPLKDKDRDSLKAERARIESALADVKNQFPPDLQEKQSKLLAASLSCADGVLKNNEVTERDILACSRDLAPLIWAGVDDAARVELDSLDDFMRKLKRELPEEEWAKLLVVICASHQPRYGDLALQYFQRLFGEKEGPGAKSEKRVVYAEAIFEEDRALRLLAKHVIDRQAADAFFGEPGRLQRDVLGDAAAAYLDKLKPEAWAAKPRLSH